MNPSAFGVIRAPRSIVFGSGSASAIPEHVASIGGRAAICVDPVLARTAGFRRTQEAMAARGVATELITDIQPELPVDLIHEAADRGRRFRPDVVLGYGGGSSLDLAKLVALLLTHDQPLHEFYGENRVPGPVVPIIAVPTTAGTGSEVTPVAVLTDPAKQLKVGVSSPYLVPHAAIVDPLLTLGAPPAVVAHAGADALVHAVEAATAVRSRHNLTRELPVFVGENDLSRPLALEAARHLVTHLPQATARPEDLRPREGLALGSLLAGIAFGSAGTHLSHAIQYPVGALTGTAHGLGTGLLLPYVLEAILPDATDRLAAIGTALEVRASSQVALAHGAIATIREVMRAIGIPQTLADIGVREADLSRITEMACGVTRLAGNSPVPADAELVGAIVRSAYGGASATDG